MNNSEFFFVPIPVYNAINKKQLVVVDEIRQKEHISKDLEIEIIVIEAKYFVYEETKTTSSFYVTIWLTNDESFCFYAKTIRDVLFNLPNMKEYIFRSLNNG